MRDLICDFDSTVTNSVQAFIDTYKQQYNITNNIKWQDCNRWDMKDVAPLIDDAEKIFSSKQFFDNLKFFPNAKEELEKISKKRKIIICTIGTYDNIYHKIKWIKDNMPFISEVIPIARNKCIMNKSLVNMKGYIFIDDNENNLYSSNADIKINFTCGGIRSWNENWHGDRLYDWENMSENIDDIEDIYDERLILEFKKE